jgi:hypothetical protein
MEVFDIVDKTPEMKPLRSSIVFRTKHDAAGLPIGEKARIVADGSRQRAGIDYSETFSPVAKATSLRAFLAHAAINDHDILQIDVKTAYLYGLLDEEVYMYPPDGWTIPYGKVLKLKKSLYGLKQAGRQWHEHADAILKDIGFKQSDADPCLYVLNDAKNTIWLLLYVDDILMSSKSSSALDNARRKLEDQVKIKVTDDALFYLGISMTRDRSKRTIALSQTAYINDILRRFGFSTSSANRVPMDTHFDLPKAVGESVDKTDYQAAIGALLYLAIWTRPDISQAVIRLSQFSSDPRVPHLAAVKRVFRYLQGTKNIVLQLGGKMELRGYADADWASDRETRRSTTGWVFFLGDGAISWASKLQQTIATSTAEAELISANSAAKEELWLVSLLRTFNLFIKTPVLFEDNQATIKMAENTTSSPRAKHIDIQYKWLNELVATNRIKLVYIPSADNTADVFTKPLPYESFLKHRLGLGLVAA